MVHARFAHDGGADGGRTFRLSIVAMLTVVALIVMGVFAGAAQASSVTSASVTLATTPAAGARSEYLVNFQTSSPNGALAAPNGKATITFPAGTDITTVSGNTFVRDVDATPRSSGICGQVRAVSHLPDLPQPATESIPPATPSPSTLDEVTNPTTQRRHQSRHRLHHLRHRHRQFSPNTANTGDQVAQNPIR